MNPADRRRIHGPLVPMDRIEANAEARKERISWIALGVFGFVTGCVLFLSFAHAAGEVGA